MLCIFSWCWYNPEFLPNVSLQWRTQTRSNKVLNTVVMPLTASSYSNADYIRCCAAGCVGGTLWPGSNSARGPGLARVILFNGNTHAALFTLFSLRVKHWGSLTVSSDATVQIADKQPPHQSLFAKIHPSAPSLQISPKGETILM